MGNFQVIEGKRSRTERAYAFLKQLMADAPKDDDLQRLFGEHAECMTSLSDYVVAERRPGTFADVRKYENEELRTAGLYYLIETHQAEHPDDEVEGIGEAIRAIGVSAVLSLRGVETPKQLEAWLVANYWSS